MKPITPHTPQQAAQTASRLHAAHHPLQAIKMMGIEGDRAEHSEVKTVRWTVFRESVENPKGDAHAA